MDSFRVIPFSIALVVATVFLATACGGTREVTSPLYVELPAANENGLTTTTASGAGTPASAVQLVSVAQERFDEVEAFYEEYLQLRANSIDGTDPIEVIDAVTTLAGRQEVVEALAYNDGLWDDERFSAVGALYLYANVESVFQVDDDTLLVVDCTEQHEINALEQHIVFWPTNEVRIDVRGGEMRVDSFTATHNGYLEGEVPLGCAPTSFRERAEVTAAQVWTDLAAWGQNPDDRTDEALSERIGDPLRERVLEAATEGFAMDTFVENSQFTAIGLDTHGRIGASGPEGIVIQVESCHRFPEGRSGYDPVTQREVQDLAPGSQQSLRFHVLLDPDFGDERLDQVVAIDLIANQCFS